MFIQSLPMEVQCPPVSWKSNQVKKFAFCLHALLSIGIWGKPAKMAALTSYFYTVVPTKFTFVDKMINAVYSFCVYVQKMEVVYSYYVNSCD